MNCEESASEPSVSVVIPAYNDPEGIRITLESVMNQTYPDDAYEVLAVDNNSDDGTQSVIKSFCGQFPETVGLVVEDDAQSQYAALNAGIRESQGSLFAFIDADMTVDETWLESIAAAMTENDWDYMGCDVDMYPKNDDRTLSEKYSMVLGTGSQMEKKIDEDQFAGAGCLVVTRRLINEVGPFSGQLRFAGDVEFGRRVQSAGFDLNFRPDITMYHPARSTLSAMLEKGFRSGRGKIHLHNHHPDRMEVRSLLDPRNYLPPHPVRVYEKIRSRLSPPTHELVKLYALAYLIKLATTTGKIYEHVTSESGQLRANSGET